MLEFNWCRSFAVAQRKLGVAGAVEPPTLWLELEPRDSMPRHMQLRRSKEPRPGSNSRKRPVPRKLQHEQQDASPLRFFH